MSVSNSPSKLVVEKLCKRYGNRLAVNELSFQVEAGQTFCLLGGNGAGKTTTFNMLLGFVQPDSGKATWKGRDLWAEKAWCRNRTFYLPENVSLYPELSAVENLRYFCVLAQLSAGREEVETALLSAGLLPAQLSMPTREFSKGMRQKTALALARLKRAELLLLDEPTSGLDPRATMEFVTLIKQLKNEGASVVMISHDLTCAHLLADEIGILQSGMLVQHFANNGQSLDNLEKQYFQYAS